MIRVKPLAVLAQYAPELDADGCYAVPYKPSLTIAEALEQMKLSETHVKYSVMVDNRRKKPDDLLEDGQTLMLMPLLAGG